MINPLHPDKKRPSVRTAGAAATIGGPTTYTTGDVPTRPSQPMHSRPLVAGPCKCRPCYHPGGLCCGSFVHHHDCQGNAPLGSTSAAAVSLSGSTPLPLLTSTSPVTSLLAHPGTSGGLPGPRGVVSVSWSTPLLTSTLPVTSTLTHPGTSGGFPGSSGGMC